MMTTKRSSKFISKALFRYHQVKWREEGKETKYGVALYDKEAEISFKKGFLRVQDPVLPLCVDVHRSMIQKIEMSYDPPDEVHVYTERAFKEAHKLSDSLPDKIVAGKLLRKGVADGYAWYVVTGISKNKKNATIEWRGFSGDRWTEPMLNYGGSFPVRMLETMVLHKGLADL